MRLSPVLCKQHLGRMFKAKWKLKSKRKIIDLGIPESLQNMNVKIYDAKELVNPEVMKEAVEIPEPYGPTPCDLDGPGHPHWNDEPVYIFNRKSRLLEGDKHAMSLTKTVAYEGFPPAVATLVDTVQDLDIEELVHHCLMEALVWDGAQRKLPKKLDITNPGWVFPREYGITHKRKVNGLLLRLTSLCERLIGGNIGAQSRVKLLDAVSKAFVEQDDRTLLFNTFSEVLLIDDKPLPTYFNQQQVQATANEPVADIFPMKPTIGLTKENMYISEEIFPITCDNRYLHTLHVTHDTVGYWFPPQKIARGIGCCFSFAAAVAHRLYGRKVRELPSPISVQGICVDVNSIGFVAYQLNTLDITGKDGIKNQMWIDGPHNLYQEISEEGGVVGYNHETFLKMLAMHLNGTQ